MSRATEDFKILRNYLKKKLKKYTILREEEFEEISGIINRTIIEGESNTAILVGPKSSGKRELVNRVLMNLQSKIRSEAILVKLNGLIHTDDRLALKAITLQMGLENTADGKVFGSFADNLNFLLASLKTGCSNESKAVIIILEKFDLFCFHHNQTLLYNLFDASQSKQAPLCVIGITERLDFMELLEKRVKSRFSHRQIFIFNGLENEFSFENRLAGIEQLFTIHKTDNLDLDSEFKKRWQISVKKLIEGREFKKLLQEIFDNDLSLESLKIILLIGISKLSPTRVLSHKLFIEPVEQFLQDDMLLILQDLSILELCLLIAMKHHAEIFDNQPMNFEMIYNRYSKFANANCSTQNVGKMVALKAFEHLEILELIYMTNSNANSTLKEHQMFILAVLPQQINEAIQNYPELPTEVSQWNSYANLT